MEPIISVKKIRKVYLLGKEKVVALQEINLDIYKGQICCILGTSGSGKSTLLNQLAGLEKPTKGCVYIGKTNISELNENKLAKFRQQNIGFIFQSYNLLPTMTALENVSMPLMFRGVPKSFRNKRAKFLLDKVGLGSRADHRPTQMSGGQQQRVGIARAFATKPKIIFADEPTGNLDSKTTIEVMELMVEMCRKNNQTLVLVTHDRELALYADRIVTLIDGRIVSDVENTPICLKEDSPKTEQINTEKQESQPEQATSNDDVTSESNMQTTVVNESESNIQTTEANSSESKVSADNAATAENNQVVLKEKV